MQSNFHKFIPSHDQTYPTLIDETSRCFLKDMPDFKFESRLPDSKIGFTFCTERTYSQLHVTVNYPETTIPNCAEGIMKDTLISMSPSFGEHLTEGRRKIVLFFELIRDFNIVSPSKLVWREYFEDIEFIRHYYFSLTKSVDLSFVLGKTTFLSLSRSCADINFRFN